jgi:peptidoglycan hydrolase-like protein with peptidoglycan-binding domain
MTAGHQPQDQNCTSSTAQNLKGSTMSLLRKRLAYSFAAVALAGGALALAPGAQAATAARVATARLGTTAAARTVSPRYSPTVCNLVGYKNSDLNAYEWVPNHTLTEGDYGDYCVELLQRGIDDIYGNPSAGVPLTIDGDFGPDTLSWVETFQRDHGCSQGVDGQAGPNTNSCLQYFTGTYNPN